MKTIKERHRMTESVGMTTGWPRRPNGTHAGTICRTVRPVRLVMTGSIVRPVIGTMTVVRTVIVAGTVIAGVVVSRTMIRAAISAGTVVVTLVAGAVLVAAILMSIIRGATM